MLAAKRASSDQTSADAAAAATAAKPVLTLAFTLAQGDAYVFNNGTVEDLHAAVHQVVLCWAYGVAA